MPSKAPGGRYLEHTIAQGVSWIRHRDTATQLKQPWTETVEQLSARMRGIVQHINTNRDVENLCRELHYRLQDVMEEPSLRVVGLWDQGLQFNLH